MVTPSCIAVSPEGCVRFWPSIAHEGSSQDTNIAELQGQECCLLTDVQPVGSVLATTTASVVLIQRPDSLSGSGEGGVGVVGMGGHHLGSTGLTCRLLKPPQGILGGIGRRVSTLLWGSGVTAADEDSKRLVQVLGGPVTERDPLEKYVYVLTSTSFQKWIIAHGDPDKMFYSCQLEPIAKQAFADNVWSPGKVDPDWVRVWLLDMQRQGNTKVSILMAAHNPNISDELHYAIGTVNVGTDAPPICFKSFNVIKCTSPEKAPSDTQQTHPGLNVNFLLSNHHAYTLLKNSKVQCTNLLKSTPDDPDEVDFANGGNAVLGSGYSGAVPESGKSGLPLFFTLTHGMVTLQPTHSTLDENPSNLTATDGGLIGVDKSMRLTESLNLTIDQAGLENLTMSESKKDQLKAAFLLYCNGNMGHATSIIEDLFPVSEGASISSAEPDASMDRLVVAISTDLIDDQPSSDPRWLETLPASETAAAAATPSALDSLKGMGATTSLLILRQLEDKKVCLDFYINFLQEVGIWDRLTSVTSRDLPMCTRLHLTEHCEKTGVAIALRTVHAEFNEVIDAAIKTTLKNRKVDQKFSQPSNLTPQDHFYREISKIHEIFGGFQMVVEKSSLTSNVSPSELVSTITIVNHLMLTMLKETLVVRGNKIQDQHLQEWIPWTCASGPPPEGLRSILIRQYQVTVDKGVPIAEDDNVKGQLFQQLIELGDLILEGYKSQLESFPPEAAGDGALAQRRSAVLKQFEKDRSALITPLLGFPECLEDAASLSERYLEFNALVRICELTGDNERLERYMDNFADHNFAHFVFDWHLRQGKQSRLLQQRSYNTGRRQNQLGQFLEGHAQISWLHNIQTGNYSEAATTLKRLSDAEAEIVGRKKTMLSLAKLSALASDEPDERVESSLKILNSELSVISAQEDLPKCVLDSVDAGNDASKMKVLSPRDLIELYIGEDNVEADHLDFKKALDLIDYLAPVGMTLDEFEVEKEQLKLRIWAMAVGRDNWNDLKSDNPIDSIKDTVFFQLVDFCFVQGLDLNSEMPSVEQLLEHESLRNSNSNVKFLIQTGYEHIHRQLVEEDVAMSG